MDNATLMVFGLLAQHFAAPQSAVWSLPQADAVANLTRAVSADGSLSLAGDVVAVRPSVLRDGMTYVNGSGAGYYCAQANFSPPASVFSGNWCDVQATLSSFYQSHSVSVGGRQVFEKSGAGFASQRIFSGENIAILSPGDGVFSFSYSSPDGRQAFDYAFNGTASLNVVYYALAAHKSCGKKGICKTWYTCDPWRTRLFSFSSVLTGSLPVTVVSPQANFSVLLDRDYGSSCSVVLGYNDSLNASNWNLDYAGFRATYQPSSYSIYQDRHDVSQVYWNPVAAEWSGNDSYALNSGYWGMYFPRAGNCSSLPGSASVSVATLFSNYTVSVPVIRLEHASMNYSLSPAKPRLGDNVTVTFSSNNPGPLTVLFSGVSTVVVPNSSGQASFSFILSSSSAMLTASQAFDGRFSSTKAGVSVASYDIVSYLWELSWLAFGFVPLFHGINKITRSSNSLPAWSFRAGMGLMALFVFLSVV